MSDKENDKSTSNEEQAPKATTLSIAPAMDLSFEAVTVPPPPKSGAGSGGMPSIPRAPALPKESRPGAAAAPAKRKRSEDDIFSIFDVETNAASDDIPVSVQTPEPVPAKPKTQLGTKSMEEREVTRSKQFAIDQDLFNMSAGLFSNSPAQSPLVAPDMSALTASGLSDKPTTSSVLDELALPTSPAAPLAPVDPSALGNAAAETTEPKKSNSKVGLIAGAFAAVALAAGAFFFFTQKPSTSEQGTTAQNAAAAPEANNLDTLPSRTGGTTETPTVAAPDKPKEEAPAATVGAPSNGSTPKDSGDKPTTKTASTDKPAAADKPAAGATTEKPAEEEPAATPPKAQSLAEAMAAGLAAGTAAPPPSGPEFNKAAAQSALGGAAGTAAGCKAPGDPSGVARVSVTFAPSGRATRAIVNGPPFAGTATGQCIAGAFRSLSVPPFSGDAVTVSKSVTIR